VNHDPLDARDDILQIDDLLPRADRARIQIAPGDLLIQPRKRGIGRCPGRAKHRGVNAHHIAGGGKEIGAGGGRVDFIAVAVGEIIEL